MIWTVFTGTWNMSSGLFSVASSGGDFMIVTTFMVQMSSVGVSSMMF